MSEAREAARRVLEYARGVVYECHLNRAEELVAETIKPVVNSHDALVEACRAAFDAMTDGDTVEPIPYIPAIEKLRSALAAVESEVQG